MERISIFGKKRSLSRRSQSENGEPLDDASSGISEYVMANERMQSEGNLGENQDADGSGSTNEHKWPVALEKLNRARVISGKVVNSDRVQVFIVLLIAINAIMLGIATFDFVEDNPNVKNAFNTVDQVFLIIFTVELGFQFLYHGWRLFLDGWLIFDLIVITMSWAFAEVQVVRGFRIFRALRLVTRIKVMKDLVVAIFGVIPRITAISLLLLLIFYIFAVMFTGLFSDLYEDWDTEWDYFGRLDNTMFTLYQIMTLDNWSTIGREMITAYSLAWIPLLAFVIITGFVVVNLMIAVICDAIAALNDVDKARVHGRGGESSEESETGPKNDSDVHVRDGANVSDQLSEADIREKIDALYSEVERLEHIQEETKVAMIQLSAHIQMRKRVVTTAKL